MEPSSARRTRTSPASHVSAGSTRSLDCIAGLLYIADMRSMRVSPGSQGGGVGFVRGSRSPSSSPWLLTGARLGMRRSGTPRSSCSRVPRAASLLRGTVLRRPGAHACRERGRGQSLLRVRQLLDRRSRRHLRPQGGSCSPPVQIQVFPSRPEPVEPRRRVPSASAVARRSDSPPRRPRSLHGSHRREDLRARRR